VSDESGVCARGTVFVVEHPKVIKTMIPTTPII